MWALVESGSVTQVFMRPKGLTIGDNQYPKNIFNLWSASELEAIGIYEVVLDNTNLKMMSIMTIQIKHLHIHL